MATQECEALEGSDKQNAATYGATVLTVNRGDETENRDWVVMRHCGDFERPTGHKWNFLHKVALCLPSGSKHWERYQVRGENPMQWSWYGIDAIISISVSGMEKELKESKEDFEFITAPWSER